MSRIGRKEISLPDKVKFELSPDGLAKITGPKGSLEYQVPADITVTVEDKSIKVARNDDSRQARANHGLVRALLNNMVNGVVTPFAKTLIVSGKGWRVEAKGKGISLQVGYSHPVIVEPEAGIELTVIDQTHFKVEGIDRQRVGQVAADLRAIRVPEPYQGHGIRYDDEHIRRKVGKKGV